MKKFLLSKACPSIVIILFVLGNGYGQTDTTKANTYDDLSLKDLLNVKIVSVSKNSEFLFDTPLSASVVTKEEIRRVGSTSIMEALRLVPGIIVREQSNGNYDIHLRGMDNIPPNASFDKASTTILVMIDSRPIYSYLRGGTFWETLPVDLNDVEKIEIIRGPAAALYGPNAVNGVINIITRQAKKDGLYVVANSQQGSAHTFINNASLGYKSNKWGIIASGNYQGRDRSQNSYFEFNRNKWLDQPGYFINFQGDTVDNVKQRYPDPAFAMRKYAGNVFLHYNAAEKIKFNLSAGLQHSMVQKVSSENEVTPLSTSSSNSRYIDLRANLKGISAQVSYNKGTQVTDYDPGNKYDFSTFDASLEYNYTLGNFSIKPGLSYRSAVYDDTKYSDTANKAGIFNARGQITTKTVSLRGEYKLINNKLRLVGGLSSNTFNYPSSTYISYEFAATYKVNKKQLVRVVYSSAPRSSNVFDTYVNQTIAFYPTGNKKFSRLALAGNKNLSLLTAGMFEVGYRGIISSKFSIDIEVFDMRAKNTNTLVTSRPYNQLRGTDTIRVTPIMAINLPLRFVQQGLTISLSYNTRKFIVKPFITVQHTRIKNYIAMNNAPDADIPGALQNNIYSGMGSEMVHKSTPAMFGGGTINYEPSSNININLNAYYYTSQTYHHISNVLFNDGVRGIDHINGKLVLNASVSYEPLKGLRLFCTGKNILDNHSREFFRADIVPFILLGGINYEF